jgi:hypothetical protein
VVSDVTSDDVALIEDLLIRMYTQLSHAEADTGDEAATLFAQYLKAYEKGQAISYRLLLLQNCVISRLSSMKCAFLILDGYDRLSQAIQILIHQTFNLFTSQLRILMTRRAPQILRSLAVDCDICPEPKKYLNLHWTCQKCKDTVGNFSLCYDCKSRKEICAQCGTDLFFIEPYAHVNFKLQVRKNNMVEFVRWSLLSTRALEAENHELIGLLAEQAQGNVTVARLRLESILGRSGSIASSRDRVSDRLPRELVAFFQAAIDKIQDGKEDLGYLTLASIVIAAENQGITVVELGEKLRTAFPSVFVSTRPKLTTTADIITAAGGCLDMILDSESGEVSCFHEDFKLYVDDDYSTALHDIKVYLQSPLAPGTVTVANILGSEHTVESPPPMSGSFDIFGSSIASEVRNDSYYPTMPLGRASTGTSRWTDSTHRMQMSPPRMNSEHQVSIFDQTTSLDAMLQTERICDFCLVHVLTGKASGAHHTSREEVFMSVKYGCIFCSHLYDDKYRQVDTSQWSYMWSIRASGSKSLAITFKHSSDHREPQIFYMVTDRDMGMGSNHDIAGKSTDPYDAGGGGQIQQWLKDCDTYHDGCRKASANDFVPTRLLELQEHDRDLVKLVITADHNLRTSYCTLSHSWGIVPFITTTEDKLNEYKTTGIEVTELPKNFRHAIDVARFIGMKYIWIDSLCIIQKDGGKDFGREGQLMHRVYQNSYCNIVAADSGDSGGGLFRTREPSKIIPAKYKGNQSKLFGQKMWSVIPGDLWDAQLLGTKIYTRGWVFQERMLSPRLLHFAKKQIFWDCGTVSACEGHPSGLPEVVDDTAATDRHWRGRLQYRSRNKDSVVVGPNDDSIETFWQTAVLKYTSCDLTKQVDKTVAIWSIAKMVRDITGETYACGLWRYNLEEQLAWRVYRCDKRARMPELQYRIPSWSWASIRGPISAAHRMVVERHYTVKDHLGELIDLPPPKESDKTSTISYEDEEPVLTMPAAIPMRTIVHQATLRRPVAGLSLLLPQLTIERTSSERDRTFEAFPDEQMDAIVSVDAPCMFVILAATRHQAAGSFSFQQGSTTAGEGATYSGVGILVEDPSEAIPHYRQEVLRLQQEASKLTDPKDKWNKDGLLDSVGYANKFIDRLAQQAKECAAGKQYYRRTGAVEFDNVSEKVWNDLMGGSEASFWLT